MRNRQEIADLGNRAFNQTAGFSALVGVSDA